MGRLLKFGCLAAVALVVIGVIAALAAVNKLQPQQQLSGQPGAPAGGQEPAKVGQTVSLKGWEVTLMDFGPWDRFSPSSAPATKPQGKLLVADMRIKNLQTGSSNFTTNDFSLKAADGREFKPVGETALIDRGFVVSQSVQPGLTTENRAVFDVDPPAKDLTFNALGVQFSVQAP